ncbi:MAG: hypothetical protein BMS9Abin34_387 [Patescibacteria group bacterium]|nr:MAG: hypothetical protein BMS9Abin34_387 [Patescibacteria group bacterium]
MKLNGDSNNANIVLPNLSYKIMGVLFNVHNELGPTLLEKYYQRAIVEELQKQDLRFKREVPVELAYKGKSIGRYFLDFLVENLVILEIKAERRSQHRHFKQVKAYLEQLRKPLGIVANFRRPRLSCRRVVNPAFRSEDLSNLDAKYSR